MTDNTDNIPGSEDSSITDENIINNEEESQKKVPFMTQLGIPLTKNSISMLLKLIFWDSSSRL